LDVVHLRRPSGESAPPYSASAANLPSLCGGSPTGSLSDERTAHSADLAAALAASLALSAAAFFSTHRTDPIEPSQSAIRGSASESWLSTPGGVSTAAMMKAPTMK